MFGVPLFAGLVGALLASIDSPLAIVAFAAVPLSFVGTAIFAAISLAYGRSTLKAAENLVYMGDLTGAASSARKVLRVVFRADYRTAAVYVLALGAERAGAFADAAQLFLLCVRAVPAMAAEIPGRRARSLMTAHAALCFAAAGQLDAARSALAHCHRELGAPPSGGGLRDLLFMDDSSFGAIGLNAWLRELERGRDPRPVAVLAGSLLALRAGDAFACADLVTREGGAFLHGLAAHERALLARVQHEALRQIASSAPHRSPSPLSIESGPHPWVGLVFPG
jgi:hypothetical protein